MIQTKDEIGELAEFVAEENISRGKTNLDKIAKNEGITVSYGNYSDYFVGMLEHDNSKFHIFLNLDKLKSPKYERTRFTFAHELGHYFIDHHRNVLKSGRSLSYDKDFSYFSNNPVEQEANYFATHLLMPKHRFISSAKEYEIGVAAVKNLAKKFKTSITATAIHYQNLVEHPCGLLFWDKDRNFKRKNYSNSLYNIVNGSGRNFAVNEAVKGELFEGFDSIFNHQESTTVLTSLSALYPDIPALSRRDIPINVETICLQSFGFISLIYIREN